MIGVPRFARLGAAALAAAIIVALSGAALPLQRVDAAPPAAPAGLIVFSSTRDGNSELYVVAADGTGLRRLTEHPAVDAFPSVSPDGSRLAFVSDRTGNRELYTMNLDGTELVRVTTDGAIDGQPDWAPDGTRIAFASSRTGNGDIYIVRAGDGTILTRLTSDRAVESAPAWSPDGTTIAFVSLRTGLGDIYAVHADGSSLRRLTSNLAPDFDPAWSPDGRRLAFASLRSGWADVYTMQADGSRQLRLTRSNAIEREPAWSPDAAEIVYTSSASGHGDLYRMREDGQGSTVLAPHAHLDASPDWTPGPAGQPGPLPPPLEGLSVTPTPEPGRTATATIGRLGGSIIATAADGTQFRLVVFAGALASDTAITVTPVAVAGLDAIAESNPHGVEFGPPGLTFAIPSRLIITPPAGSHVPARVLVAEWGPGPGIVLRLPLRESDGSLHLSVAHFSGESPLQARATFYDQLVAQAVALMPGLGTDGPLASHAGSLPASGQAVADDLQRLYLSRVTPALDVAADNFLAFVEAQALVMEFRSLVLMDAGLGSLVGAGGTEDLDTLSGHAVARLIEQGQALRNAYRGSCTATVSDVLDWLVVPLALDVQIALAGGGAVAQEFCLAPEVLVISPFPSPLEASPAPVSAQVQGGLLAPAGTPGGIAAAGGAFFRQPTTFNLTASGGTFATGGGSSLVQTTGADGLLTVELNRTGEPRVSVAGAATIEGLGLSLVGAGGDNTLPVNLTSAEQGFGLQYTFSPPVNQILEPGGLTNLCVLVTDVEGLPIESRTVSWILSGPGALNASSSVTGLGGVACIDYDHPAGLVTRGQTARVEASAIRDGLERSDSVTLTPRWASLAIEAHVAGGGAFVPTTNTTFPVLPGQAVVLRARLTGPGATPADPPVALTEFVSATIYDGGGSLTDSLGNALATQLLLTDPANPDEVTWDPLSSTGDTTLLFRYPDGILDTDPGIAATVTLGRAPIDVTVSPESATLVATERQQFSATVIGGTNTSVTWSSTGGSITADGLYTAGASTGTFHVTATSVEDPSRSASSTVTIIDGLIFEGTITETFDGESGFITMTYTETYEVRVTVNPVGETAVVSGNAHVRMTTIGHNPDRPCLFDQDASGTDLSVSGTPGNLRIGIVAEVAGTLSGGGCVPSDNVEPITATINTDSDSRQEVVGGEVVALVWNSSEERTISGLLGAGSFYTTGIMQISGRLERVN